MMLNSLIQLFFVVAGAVVFLYTYVVIAQLVEIYLEHKKDNK